MENPAGTAGADTELAAQAWRARVRVCFYFVPPAIQGREADTGSGQKRRGVYRKKEIPSKLPWWRRRRGKRGQRCTRACSSASLVCPFIPSFRGFVM